MAYETEVFVSCGAWSNLTVLEESLLLIELMELYDTTIQKEQRFIRSIGAAMGAEYGPEPGTESADVVVYGENEVKQLPFGLGYETV